MSESRQKIKSVEEYLDSIPKFSKSGVSAANFDLSRMRNFCEKMGNPQKDFRAIHVAGTNGKGTVCRMLASVYQQAGYNVGLYTSPHLIKVTERFQVNAKQMDGSVLADFFDEYRDYLEDSEYTYFEITTAIAFWYFSKMKVDLAVLEVGLGGRLDATNVIEPEICAITSIGLDHTEILGDSIQDIAFEKSGIIKFKTPVVIGNVSLEAEEVIHKVAKSKESDVIKTDNLKPNYTGKQIVLNQNNSSLTIDGTHWKKIDALNVAIVYKIAETLTSKFPVTTAEFVEGIESVSKRFLRHAVFEKLPAGQTWFFDGAHNAQSVKILVNHLVELAPAEKWSVVLSFMKDKLTPEIADEWNNFPNIYVYEMEGERAAQLEMMKRYFPSAGVIETPDVLLSDQFKSELVIFSGSFYFYSIVSTWMGAIASADQINPSAL